MQKKAIRESRIAIKADSKEDRLLIIVVVIFRLGTGRFREELLILLSRPVLAERYGLHERKVVGKSLGGRVGL